MKVLHIITGLENGGAESTLFRLVTADKENTHVVLSLTKTGVYGERLLQAGIHVEVLGMQRGSINPKLILKLSRLIKFLEPDVVQTWMYHSDLIGGIAAKMAGVKAIAWGVRNSTLDRTTTSLSTRLVARICAFISRVIPTKITTCSTNAKQVHIELGYSADKFMVIPNGYDLKKLFPDSDSRALCRSKWGFNQEDIVIGVVARWDPQKDHKNLVNALGKLSTTNLKCVFIGTNMDANNTDLVNMVNASGASKSIYLMGPTTEIPLVMNGLDLHILPSAYGEAFPNVVAEAMACGTPCIATDVGDAEFIIGDTGWIVPPCDSDALANAIQNALDKMGDKEIWQQKQIQCAQRITDLFSIEKMVNSFNQIWLDISRKGK